MRLFRLIRDLRGRLSGRKPYIRPILTINGDGVTRYVGDDSKQALNQLEVYLRDTYRHRFVFAIDRMHDRYYEFAPWIAANRTGAVYHWANERLGVAGLYFESPDDALAFRMRFERIEVLPEPMTFESFNQVMERCLEI